MAAAAGSSPAARLLWLVSGGIHGIHGLNLHHFAGTIDCLVLICSWNLFSFSIQRQGLVLLFNLAVWVWPIELLPVIAWKSPMRIMRANLEIMLAWFTIGFMLVAPRVLASHYRCVTALLLELSPQRTWAGLGIPHHVRFKGHPELSETNSGHLFRPCILVELVCN